MKNCSVCKEGKDDSEFYKVSGHPEKLMSLCKGCLRISARASSEKYREKIAQRARDRYWKDPERSREQSKQWAKKNPEKARAADRKYRQKNPEKVKAWDKTKRLRHAEKIKARAKEYLKRNWAKHLERARAWAAAHPENRLFHCNQRRTRRIRATVGWANEEYIRLFYVLAKVETGRTGKKCHVDHIVPLKSPLVCGLHHEHNLQISFYDDNIRKGNRWWPDMPEPEGASANVPAYAFDRHMRAVT